MLSSCAVLSPLNTTSLLFAGALQLDGVETYSAAVIAMPLFIFSGVFFCCCCCVCCVAGAKGGAQGAGGAGGAGGAAGGGGFGKDDEEAPLTGDQGYGSTGTAVGTVPEAADSQV